MRRLTLLLMAAALVLSVVPAVPATNPTDDDAGSGGDAGDTPDQAVPIVPGSYRGTLTAGVDEEDWYSFHAEVGQGIRLVDQALENGLRFAGECPDPVEVSFFGDDRCGVETGEDFPFYRSPPLQLVGPNGEVRRVNAFDAWVVDQTGTWYVHPTLSPENGSDPLDPVWNALWSRDGHAVYRFALAVDALPAHDDLGTGQDAPDVPGDPDRGELPPAALDLAEGRSQANVSAYDPVDVFRFEVGQGATPGDPERFLLGMAFPPGAEVDVIAYRSMGTHSIEASFESGDTAAPVFSWPSRVWGPQTWFVEVHLQEATFPPASYDLSLWTESGSAIPTAQRVLTEEINDIAPWRGVVGVATTGPLLEVDTSGVLSTHPEAWEIEALQATADGALVGVNRSDQTWMDELVYISDQEVDRLAPVRGVLSGFMHVAPNGTFLAGGPRGGDWTGFDCSRQTWPVHLPGLNETAAEEVGPFPSLLGLGPDGLAYYADQGRLHVYRDSALVAVLDGSPPSRLVVAGDGAAFYPRSGMVLRLDPSDPLPEPVGLMHGRNDIPRTSPVFVGTDLYMAQYNLSGAGDDLLVLPTSSQGYTVPEATCQVPEDPDLVVTDVTIGQSVLHASVEVEEGSVWPEVRAGEWRTISVTVANQGPGPVNRAFMIEVSDRCDLIEDAPLCVTELEGPGTLGGPESDFQRKFHRGGLAPGEEVTVSFQWATTGTYGAKDVHTVVDRVPLDLDGEPITRDPGGNVFETDETNNEAMVTYFEGPP